MNGERAGNPRELAAWFDRHGTVPEGTWERFNGYGVMGLPFSSGHILALRRFPASSIGPSYTSVWHRSPVGRWTFYSDNEPGLDCTRYFSAAVNESIQTEILLDWSGPYHLIVTIPSASFRWELELRATWRTKAMNAAAAVLPRRWWESRPILSVMGSVARLALGVGKVRLWGRSANGQRFLANPRRIWIVSRSTATLKGEDLGTPGPVEVQASLGDFRIPQRGLLIFGQAYFECRLDPEPREAVAAA